MEEETKKQDQVEGKMEETRKPEVEEQKVEDSKTENEDAKKEKTKDKKLYEEFEIPEGIIANLEDDVLIMKKDDKELIRKLPALITIKVEGNKIILSAARNRRIERKLFGTFKSHIKNMIKGFTEGFKYKLQIANVHFPMNVSHDKENNELIVKNFLGEKKDRRIKLVEDVNVKIENENIELESFDIERAGQVATNIEKGTRVRNKDRRIFQDGIFLVSKPRREFM